MVTKTIRINFAHEKLWMRDHFYPDVFDALHYISHDLYARYGIILREISEVNSISISIKIEVPDEINKNFNIGKRLKGLSNYLLKNYPERYKPYLVGTRLLYYWEDFEKEGGERW